MRAPTNNDFFHLRTHTEFSVVDGTLRIPDAAAAAARDGQPARAITDRNNLFGAVKFYGAVRKRASSRSSAATWLEGVTVGAGRQSPPNILERCTWN